MKYKLILFSVGLALLTNAAVAMGVFPGGNVIKCTGSGFSWGRSFASPIQTDRMDPVEICLRSKEGKDLVLRVPGAFLTSVIRDKDGRPAFLNIEFWMLPDPRPESAVVELRGSAQSDQRAQFYNANLHKRIYINLGAEPFEGERYVGLRKEYIEFKEKLPDTPFGLEHFTRRGCDRQSELKYDKTTRKCKEGDAKAYGDVYFGRSNISDQWVMVWCSPGSPVCTLHSTFERREMMVGLRRENVSNWRWYEVTANQFLSKYVARP